MNPPHSPIQKTGHPEIDAQHDELVELTARLGQICVDPEAARECAACPDANRDACVGRLASLIGDLLGFMVRHFAYEEALMRLLPPTPVCRRHVEAHQIAHAEISERLSELTRNLDTVNPYDCAQRLSRIIEAWMGNHTAHLDRPLAAELEKAYDREIGYDVELARLLSA